jgi:hypothetical protein
MPLLPSVHHTDLVKTSITIAHVTTKFRATTEITQHDRAYVVTVCDSDNGLRCWRRVFRIDQEAHSLAFHLGLISSSHFAGTVALETGDRVTTTGTASIDPARLLYEKFQPVIVKVTYQTTMNGQNVSGEIVPTPSRLPQEGETIELSQHDLGGRYLIERVSGPFKLGDELSFMLKITPSASV